MATSTIRSARRLRTRNASRSRVERSDQCRSSSTSTSGRSAAIRPSRPSASSNRRPWVDALIAGAGSAGGSPRSGSSRASSAPPGASSSRGRVVEAAGVVAQRLDERAERQPALLDVDAAADQRASRRLAAGARDELLGEPGLPDPGLAAHHEQLGPALARRRQPVFEPPQLLLAAHETTVRRQLDNESQDPTETICRRPDPGGRSTPRGAAPARRDGVRGRRPRRASARRACCRCAPRARTRSSR